MKTQLLRLGSVVPYGVGGPESGSINLIYSILLQDYKQDVYNYIGINQIGIDLNELIMKEPGNKVYINIRYPTFCDFENRSVDEQNSIRLDVIHQSLLRIAAEYKKLEVEKLEVIKDIILKNNFLFDFVYKTYKNKKNKDLISKIIIQPLMKRFDIYVLFEENGKKICKLLIYSGGTDNFYFESIFANGKWNGTNEFVITGKTSEMEIHVNIEKCTVKYINKYGAGLYAPFFELMKTHELKEQNEIAYKNWLQSLPSDIVPLLNMPN